MDVATAQAPVNADTIDRAQRITDFAKANLQIDSPEDVVATVHAFLVIFTMHAKLIGLDKEMAVAWFSNQWDGLEVETNGKLLTMPTVGGVH